MTMKEAIRLFNNYLHSNHKQRTIDSYVHVLGRFEMIHAQRDLDSGGCLSLPAETPQLKVLTRPKDCLGTPAISCDLPVIISLDTQKQFPYAPSRKNQ
ncbi:MAG: hypothetical protein WCO89_10575, partial [Syntrophus sp. (in: bacteria)]